MPEDGLTVAVNVTPCPKMDGFPEELMTVVVLRVEGFTVKELLVPPMPLFPPVPVALIVKLPAFETVTLWFDRTPFVNAGVVTGAPTRLPVEVRVTLLPFPLKLVTVFPKASSALIVMLNGVPACCVVIVLNTNLLRAAKLTKMPFWVAEPTPPVPDPAIDWVPAVCNVAVKVCEPASAAVKV